MSILSGNDMKRSTICFYDKYSGQYMYFIGHFLSGSGQSIYMLSYLTPEYSQ